MHVRERMIRERLATQPCEECGHRYGPGTVLVLARRPTAWLVLAACRECEHRCIYLASFPDSVREPGATHVDADPSSLSMRRAYPSEHEPTVGDSARNPVTSDEVAAMRAFLAEFDGDFHRLFASGDNGRS